jgi:hypothetical protein
MSIMTKLSFISDNALKDAVKHLLDVALQGKKKAEDQFGRNVIDPFAILFEMAGFDLDAQTWEKSEQTRQAQKSLQNHIGTFHQRILGSVNGWRDLDTGSIIDLECPSQKIIAEVKNKYNTVKGSDQVKIYDNFANLVLHKGQAYRGYTAYYVEIIPNKPIPYNIEFTPSDNQTGQRRPSNPQIRRIDGKTFYALVTGQADALDNLYDLLPSLIESCSSIKYRFADLRQIQEYFRKAYGDRSTS